MAIPRSEWRPPWATHVLGTYDDAPDEETGEQRLDAKCETCGATWKGVCVRNAPRTRIARFAVAHFHGDPLAKKPE